MSKKNEVRLPPFQVEELKGLRLLAERTNWSFRHYKIKELWKTTQGKDVKVAVLDTGCPAHKDIDVEEAMDFTGEGVEDRLSGHSTWVCGCIVAKRGFLGIAPKCRLYVGKVLGNDGSGNWNWMKEGLEWALEENMQVINISAGGHYTGSAIQPILKELNRKGVLVVCAAGNSDKPLIFPASSPDTLAVGAINKKWQRASFSNFGPRLIVMAPGVDLLGCWLDNGYSKLTGSSMSSPGVAGVLALQTRLRLMNLEEATARFAETSKDMEEEGWDLTTGWGAIEPHKFLGLEEPKKKKVWGWLLFLLFLLLKVPIALDKK